jgi:1-deoxy-D-xylulose-5-phosphate synthase
VVDPRWVKPLDPALVELARAHRAVVTIEDNGRTGGVGAAVTALLQDEGLTRPIQVLGIPREFLDHAKRPAILERLGLTAEGVAAAARTALR